MNKLITKKLFIEEEIKSQIVFINELWSVLLPKKPICPFHLMLVSNQQNDKTFTDLNDQSLVNLRDCIRHLVGCMTKKYGDIFDGYNLFSNNGSDRVGQHMNQFHQHIFLRLKSEPESPYKIMGRGESWEAMGSKEWDNQHQELIDLFK